MAIKIKRSTGDLAPASLAAGQLAYTEGMMNGGTLYYGEIGGAVREIGGRKFVDSLNTLVGSKGQALGLATLGMDGKVPSTQLPSYVDDVVEIATASGFPTVGEGATIYVAADTGKVYRWSGSTYVEIVAAPGSTDAVTEGTTNLYFTNARARAAISVAGSLSYDNATGVITGAAAGIASVSADTTPELGGNLDVSGYSIAASSGDVVVDSSAGGWIKLKHGNFETGAGFVAVGNGTNPGAIAGENNKDLLLGAGLASSGGPSLITLVAGGDVVIDANSSGNVVISGQSFPNANGTTGQVLTTDGSGNLSWSTVSGFSGDYNDLTNKPTLFSGAYADLTGKPTLVTAFTGLSDVPSSYTGTGGYFVRVNAGATALEFSQDVDDGTF